jgi:hypothetical protein
LALNTNQSINQSIDDAMKIQIYHKKNGNKEQKLKIYLTA